MKHITDIVGEKNIYLSRISRVSRVENPLLLKNVDADEITKFKMNNMEILNKKSEKGAYNVINSFPWNSFLIKHKKKVFETLVRKYFKDKQNFNYNNLIF
jgi:homoserine trans-succinylase